VSCGGGFCGVAVVRGGLGVSLGGLWLSISGRVVVGVGLVGLLCCLV